jgi:hypothetical protein
MAGHREDGTFAEDKAHHPNRRPIDSRYANTPRLAKVMARRITDDIRMGSPLTHNKTREVTPAEAQNALNQYRNERDMYGKYDTEVSDKAQQIYNALYFEKHGY